MTEIKYYIKVNTLSDFTQEQKLELLADFRNLINTFCSQRPDLNIIACVGKELCDEDIMESLK